MIDNYINERLNVFQEETGKMTEVPAIIKRFGIISDDGAYNCVLRVRGYAGYMRGRSSMLIVRKNGSEWEVYLEDNTADHRYSAPGGGWNENESPKDAAIREAKEEVFINVKDVEEYPEVLIEYHNEIADWVKKHVEEKYWWKGYYSKIFVGQYGSKFSGHVDDIDKDEKATKSEWIKVKDLDKDKMPKEYMDAILWYINKILSK